MERPRPEQRACINVYADDAKALRRVARLLPGLTANGVGLRALRAGLPLVERELLDSARRLLDEPPAEDSR